MENEEEIKNKIIELESSMNSPDFWSDKVKAQDTIKLVKNLKDKLDGEKALDKGNAVISIIAGAGGDDSEDWARMLFNMYSKYIEREGWSYRILHAHTNEHDGYKNMSFEVSGKWVNGKGEDMGAYGRLKNESGVHRLVRISPFNANDKRHTSFALVEVLPILPEIHKVNIDEKDLDISFANAGGPGGQNVNKRETKVLIKHVPSGIQVQVATERDQLSNKKIALELIQAKLFKMREESKKAELEGRQISKTTEIEWGNQIRNYVLHPYKLIKDLRSGVETTNIDEVLEKGDLDEFLNSN
jgi:peptide chain release factor 2